jgi:hypothetical protein
MIQRLPTSPGFAGRSSQKKEIFQKISDLAAFMEACSLGPQRPDYGEY